MNIRPAAFYSFSFFFIFCWWMLAYRNHEADEPQSKVPSWTEKNRTIKSCCNLNEIEMISREMLVKALLGDTDLMGELILKWDIDAKIMQHDGVLGIQRLDLAKFVECQKICRALNEKNASPLIQDIVVDEIGTPFDPSQVRNRILPQTYMAADIILALKGNTSIVALPKGYKKQEYLFPKHLLEDISFEFDRYEAEALFIHRPHIAFVSRHCSDHYALDLLKAQGVELFFVPTADTMEDLCTAIIDIGDVSSEPLKGRLLSTFVEALFLAVDNWRISHNLVSPANKILAVTFYNRFSIPGTKSLTDPYLKRMGIDNFAALIAKDPRLDSFSVPISEEEIAYFNPDLMIILTDNQDGVENILKNHRFLDKVSAKLTGSIVYVSEKVQIAPSQAMALAYYDLNLALIKLKEVRE